MKARDNKLFSLLSSSLLIVSDYFNATAIGMAEIFCRYATQAPTCRTGYIITYIMKDMFSLYLNWIHNEIIVKITFNSDSIFLMAMIFSYIGNVCIENTYICI